MTSTIKVNKIEKVDGSTIELGGPGTSVNLASGATQSGFGRTGTVDWQTSVKTLAFTAVSGEGYFVNTTSAPVTATLPASPSAGDIVSISDYAKTAAINNITIGRNGSNIDGFAGDLTLSTAGSAVTLVYIDSTKGWKPVNSNEITGGPKYVVATGGTESTCGDFRIHTFTSSSDFSVTCRGNPLGSDTVEYLVVAGGGAGGGDDIGGGGGAGGFRFASPSIAPLTYPAKPLAAPAGLPVSEQDYPITVGAGGAAVSGGAVGNSGNNSIFSTITSAGGGGGGSGNSVPTSSPLQNGAAGGSGGGGGLYCGCGGSGNTPPVSPPQGNNGATCPYPVSSSVTGGGGGGAISAGNTHTGTGSGGPGGNGGGLPTAFGSNGVPCGSFRYYAGGGAGSGDCSPFGTGGLGGGGAGGPSGSGVPGLGGSGTANSGGGGGGTGGKGASGNTSGAGGSGIVIIRYKFQN